jgi:hypothetical protein
MVTGPSHQNGCFSSFCTPSDAVRDRLAWKYALSLELCDAGFDHTVLSEFRARLVEGQAEQRLLDVRIASGVNREGGSKLMDDNAPILPMSSRKSVL